MYAPSDDLSVRFTADYDEYDEICCAVGSTSYGPANAVVTAFGGQIVPNNPYTEKAFFDFDPISDGDNSGLSIYIIKNFDNFRFESITSKRNLITMKYKMLILILQILLHLVQYRKILMQLLKSLEFFQKITKNLIGC